MKRTFLTICFFALFSFFYTSFAQMSYGGSPRSFKYNLSANIPSIEMEAIDVEALLLAHPSVKGQALPVGIVTPINYTMENCGMKDYLPNGDVIWRVQVVCPNATFSSINFSKFIIPEGADLFFYTPDHEFVIGKFTNQNQMEGEIFYPQDIPGDEFIIEYYEPAKAAFHGTLEMDQVSQGYRDIFHIMNQNIEESTKALIPGSSGANGSCHPNAMCYNTQWHDQINSVVCYTMSDGYSIGMCSGAMINNTARNGKKYLLSANHCYSSGVTWKFYFGYQASSCNATDAPIYKTATGCNVKARDNGTSSSDFMLVEITGAIDPAYNVFLAGWDISTSTPSPATSCACIHHPGGDKKKCSIPANVINGSQAGMGKYWAVNWSYSTGTTEGGSSGSPLFNPQKLIVGQLYAGQSCCVANDDGEGCTGPGGYDVYGKISNSWTNNDNSSDAKKLKPWLDPTNSGATTLQGEYLNTVGVTNYTEVVDALSVFPNPTKGEITIHGNFNGNYGVCNIYNVVGSLVSTRQLSLSSEMTMNLDYLDAGIYFIEIMDNDHKYRSKLVITK